jgi:hypothetical protein
MNTTTKISDYKLNFIKNQAGFFVYHASSLNVPKAEDLYSEAEISAALKRMLSSLTVEAINALKVPIGNDNWYSSKITINNFTTYIYEDKENVSFINQIVYPKLNQKYNGENLEFDIIAKAVESVLYSTPKKGKGKYDNSKTNTYNLNKSAELIITDKLGEVYFKLTVRKDDNGNIPINANKKQQLKDIYDADKLCKSVKQIKDELAKKNKSQILGDKNGSKYTTLLDIENFKGSIIETDKYFEYTGYVNVNTYQDDNYNKEFEYISSILQNCLQIKVLKNRDWQPKDIFISGNTNVEIGMNTKETNMWIILRVLK